MDGGGSAVRAAQGGAVRTAQERCDDRAQASFLEQGRCVRAHAAVHEIGETFMTRRACALVAIFAAAAAVRAAGPATSYTADPATSRLEFAGVQAGAEFKGSFRKFSAPSDFPPHSPPTRPLA